jgi:hypothetical protein
MRESKAMLVCVREACEVQRTCSGDDEMDGGASVMLQQ